VKGEKNMGQQNNSNTTSLTTESTESTVKEPVSLVEKESSTKSNITLEEFKTMLESNIELKGYFDSETDKTVNKRLNKAVESWKEQNLQSIVEAEIEKRYPKKTQAEIDLEKKIAEIKKLQEEKRQLDLKLKYQEELRKNELDPEVLKFVVGENMDSTLANIKEFKEILNKTAKAMAQEEVIKKLGENSYKPPSRHGFSTKRSIWEQ
jgi:hypothetical protein